MLLLLDGKESSVSYCFFFCNLHNTLFLAFVCLFEEGVENPQIPGFSSARIRVEVHRRQLFSTFSSHFSPLSVFVLHWLRCQRRPLLNASGGGEEKRPRVVFLFFLPLLRLCWRHLSLDVLSLSLRRSALSAPQSRPMHTAVIHPPRAERRPRQEEGIPDAD